MPAKIRKAQHRDHVHESLRTKIRSKGMNVAPTRDFFLPFIQSDDGGCAGSWH